jgi:transcriptional regulator with XRE-family HTH domain|tara:strand:- start:79 stop:237 length:159 start_codon:yes stop_codon:yes gene_type:complete
LTQLDLAIKADMEENAIQRIEKGRTNPTTKTLIRIAIALNLEVADLFPKFID